MPLSVATAELVGTLLEAACYGMYLLVFFQCLKVFYRRYRDGRNVWYLLVTTFVMFGLITAHVILNILRAVEAFTSHTDVPNEPEIYYGLLSSPTRVAKTTTYVVLTLVSDIVFVYRVFAIYGRNYYIAFVPFMLWASDIGLAAWSMVTFTAIGPGDIPMVHSLLIRVTNFYILTLVLNVLCTLMISWRIWNIHRQVHGRAIAGVRIYGIIAIIIESAGLYSGLLIFLIVTTVLGHASLWIVLNPICPAIGMIFSAMLVRASKEYHTNTYLTNDVTLPSPLDDPEDGHTATCASSRTLTCIQEHWVALCSKGGRAPTVDVSGDEGDDVEKEMGRNGIDLERLAYS